MALSLVSASADETPAAKLATLALTFPSLRNRNALGVSALRDLAADPHCAHGARHAAIFCLHVHNCGRNAFNLGAAWGGWDNAHRAAWKAWAAEPWFA